MTRTLPTVYPKSTLGRQCTAIALVLAMWPVCSQAWLLSSVAPAHFPYHPSLSSLSPRGLLSTMRQLEREADRMMSTLLEVGEIGRSTNATDTHAASPTDNEGALANFQLRLRPSFDVEERQDAFVITAATPGLSKDDMTVDVLDGDDGAAYLVIAGQTSRASKATDAAPMLESNQSSDKETTSTSMSLKASYSKFERKIKLPPTVDRKKVKASYDQGLLNVIIPKNPKQQLKLRVNID